MDPDIDDSDDELVNVLDLTTLTAHSNITANNPHTYYSNASADISFKQNNRFDADLEVKGKMMLNDMDVGATLETMQERFLILEADFKKHEQYPALKDAYEQYKMLEKLLMDSNVN